MKSSPSRLYPSKNYQKLEKIISSHYDVSELVGVHSVIGVIIDGVPGLGKTKFADFAADEGLAGTVNKIDMTAFLNLEFSVLMSKFYHQFEVEYNTIFMIGEVDKYLDVRIDREYEIYKIENFKRNSENDGDELVMPMSFKEFQVSAKNKFLFEMLAVLERDGLKKSVVVIFCSNNFHSIFEGVDLTHHKSLYDRFIKINFEKCDHQEIIQYIDHYNEKLQGTRYQCPESTSVLGQLLRSDISVTHRVLHQISIECQYDPIKIIHRLNTYVTCDLENVMSGRQKQLLTNDHSISVSVPSVKVKTKNAPTRKIPITQ